MTDLATASMPEPDPPPSSGDRTKKVFIAIVVAVLVILGLKLLIGRWVRGGGPRRSVTGLAEDGAVKLADALLDEVLGPV
jgi:hypothetical protein